jgi:hypothetical protein
VVAALAGCGRFMFEEREPWRRDAEVACLKSGAIRESAGVARIARIDGPGICGADFPLKVAALGESTALGFSGEPPRPPGNIPTGSLPRWPINQAPPPAISAVAPRYAPPAPPAAPRTIEVPGAPLELGPPLDRSYDDRAPAPHAITPYPLPAPGSVPLGPPVPAYTGVVEVKPAATLACPLIAALDRWMAQSVQPAAQRWFRQPVVEIRQISAYSCRSMNNQRGARISEHAFGNALDVAAFVFADGRIVKVKDGWRGPPEEQGFLRDVQGAACEQFTTVLAPGADAFHYDHIHVDLMRRGSRRRICQPEAVDGELVAARAQQRAPVAKAPAPRTPPTQRTAPFDERNDPYAWRGAAAKRDDAFVTGTVRADPDWVEDDGARPPLQ